jgi:beta-lactamase superfamily II metal-dependent hydrolase
MNKIVSVIFLVFAFALNVNSQSKSNFELWQLPSQINTIGNSYVFRTADGKIAVMDGGVDAEAPYLRGFLAALGNKVDIWFISHPHPDHIGALFEILKDPKDLKIGKVYYSEFSSHLSGAEPDYKQRVEEFYAFLKNSGIPVVNVREAGLVIKLDKTLFKILGVTNEDILVNPYNNSSMIIRVWDDSKSMLFLGDCGKEEGDRLLAGPYRQELDCDYIQMAHHGQQGVSKDFYRSVKFKACLWPTPSWVYNNDAGKGFNTHILKTVEIRELIDSLGIQSNYISWKGLTHIR